MHIRILSPSGAIEPQYIDQAAEVLRRQGHVVSIAPHAKGKAGRFAASDSERVEDMVNALHDNAIDALLCARGGYGLQRIIDQLPPVTKPVIGFSDITALHLLCARTGQPSLHGLMCKHIAQAQDNNLYATYWQALDGQDLHYSQPAHPLNREGHVRGTLIGGNLSVLYGLQGTPYGLPALLPSERTESKPYILFIEDIAERHYHIDRMMNNLRLSGVLARISGLVVGQFTDCEDDPSMGCTVYETIRQAVAEYAYPVVFDFPAGHTDANYPLYLNAAAEVEVTPYSSTIVSAFMSS